MDIVTYALCKKYIKASLEGAGALKGQKGDSGLSAYEIAKKNGYSGTEAQWLEKIQGKDGSTPYIGDNGNWYINDIDTNIPGRAIRSYNELTDLPDIPTKVSEFINDAGFITQADIPTDISEFVNDVGFITQNDIPTALSAFSNDVNFIAENDNISKLTNNVGYITSNDITDFAKTSEVPTKVSQLQNDKNYLTSHQVLKTINNQSIVGTGNLVIGGAVDDVQVNGVSVVSNKIANISLDLNATMGRNFTTNNTVGFLQSGTVIQSTDTIADILYKILYKEETINTKITMIFGGADNTPISEDDLEWLDWKESVTNIDPDSLLSASYRHLITTGNLTTEEGQYPVMACSKAVKLVQLSQWSAEGADSIPLNFNTVETEHYNIYYIPTRTYDEDTATHGTNFIFTFVEG